MRTHRTLLPLLFTLAAVCAHAQDGPRYPVKAVVLGLRPVEGNVLYIGLLALDGSQLEGQRIPVTAERMEVDLGSVAAGQYAVRLYQDENGNGKLDTGTFKIPKEGVGCSNNATGFMSAPALKDMLFEVDGPKAVGIAMKYY